MAKWLCDYNAAAPILATNEWSLKPRSGPIKVEIIDPTMYTLF
jgi:hypothetical protein